MPSSCADEIFMRRALAIAKRGWGDTSPNPMVGAVLVKNGRIIGEGWHRRDGGAHAEIECLRSTVESPEAATIYVTLEPCTTSGRTGACSEAIKAAKIASVKVGATDPNPVHAGRAERVFADAGIACEFGILGSECSELNFIFNKSVVSKRAVLALKYAVTSDGKIAERRGFPSRITECGARENAMLWRALFSATAVGSGTLKADNPHLTVRGFVGFGGTESAIGMTAENLVSAHEAAPIFSNTAVEYCRHRIVFGGGLSFAESSSELAKIRLFSDGFTDKTVVVCSQTASLDAEKNLRKTGAEVVRISAQASSACEYWDAVKAEFFSRGIVSILLEGGAAMFASVNAARAADFAFEYVSPRIFGGGLDAFNGGRPFDFGLARRAEFSPDSLVYGDVKYK